jgi:hypothetical protein
VIQQYIHLASIRRHLSREDSVRRGIPKRSDAMVRQRSEGARIRFTFSSHRSRLPNQIEASAAPSRRPAAAPRQVLLFLALMNDCLLHQSSECVSCALRFAPLLFMLLLTDRVATPPGLQIGRVGWLLRHQFADPFCWVVRFRDGLQTVAGKLHRIQPR